MILCEMSYIEFSTIVTAFCGSHHPYKFLYIQFSTFTQNRLFFIQILLSVGSVVELGLNWIKQHIGYFIQLDIKKHRGTFLLGFLKFVVSQRE